METKYALSVHSSKALLVEQISLPVTALADGVIQHAITKEDRHEVNSFVPINFKYAEVWLGALA